MKEILLYTGVSDCNMEEGSLRCDANVSVRPRGQKEFGAKVEVKNVNSFRFVRLALEYEIERQIEVIVSVVASVRKRASGTPTKAALLHALKGAGARLPLFPEPDLRAHRSDEFLAETKKKLPELPEARRARMIAEYELSTQDAHTLTGSREFADRFEAAARGARNPRRVANLLLSEVADG